MVPQNEQSQLSFMLRFNIILELIPKINLALNRVSKSIVCSQIQKKNQIDEEKKQGWSITSDWWRQLRCRANVKNQGYCDFVCGSRLDENNLGLWGKHSNPCTFTLRP